MPSWRHHRCDVAGIGRQRAHQHEHDGGKQRRRRDDRLAQPADRPVPSPELVRRAGLPRGGEQAGQRIVEDAHVSRPGRDRRRAGPARRHPPGRSRRRPARPGRQQAALAGGHQAVALGDRDASATKASESVSELSPASTAGARAFDSKNTGTRLFRSVSSRMRALRRADLDDAADHALGRNDGLADGDAVAAPGVDDRGVDEGCRRSCR